MPAAPTYEALLLAMQAQASRVGRLVGSLTDDDYDRPTRTNGWDVRTLVAHLARIHSSVLPTLAATVDGPAGLTAREYFTTARAYADDVSRLAQEQQLGRSPAQLRRDVQSSLDAAVVALADTDGAELVRTRSGVMTAREFTWTRVVEQVVHTQDLLAAVRENAPSDRRPAEFLFPAALTLTCRLLAERAVAKAPGGAVELRVPPRVAVQLVEGSRHTRGTPPNTVEMAEGTFVELAGGRVGWGFCERVGLLTAKGDRSDLSSLMPLL